jgi:hypothetical protein
MEFIVRPTDEEVDDLRSYDPMETLLEDEMDLFEEVRRQLLHAVRLADEAIAAAAEASDQ